MGRNMTGIGRLITAETREAWLNEARDFTPWLAENLDLLGEAIGLQLEAEGTEVAVDTFSADILARDLDGNLVLIENQLDGTDHRHLGQIMTYLAGLKATTVVWIATGFRDAHLSALKWLNDHTVAPYAFFAVKLRVVRIGDSQPAPIFDVVARPDNWERQVQKVVEERTGERSESAERRRSFWTRYLELYPEDGEIGIRPSGAIHQELRPTKPSDLVIVALRNANAVGVLIRGRRGMVTPGEVIGRTAGLMDRLREAIDPRLWSTEQNAPQVWRDVKPDDPADWDAAANWLHDRLHRARTALDEIVLADE